MGSQEAWSVATMILDHFGYHGKRILQDPNQPVENKIRGEIKKIVLELHKNKPIQYVLGTAFFYDLEFYVNEKVLIPRPETEQLIQMIILENTTKAPAIIDIGTGSGCIAIALSLNIKGAEVLGTDVSAEALKIAKKNAHRHQSRASFVLHSVFDSHSPFPKGKFDILVSNPPYVTEKEKELMEANVLENEPHQALFVPNAEPLLFYEAIIQQANYLLHEQGEVWIEINEQFGKETAELFNSEGYRNVRLIKDIHDKDRFIYAEK